MGRIVVLCCILLTGLQAMAQRAALPLRDSLLIKQLFFDGLRDKLSENYEKSNESFSRISAVDPGNTAAWYEIALLNFRQNKMPQAQEAIQKAIAGEHDNVWYYKLLAELDKSTGNLPALLPVVDQLIRLAPEQKNFYLEKANALTLLGRKEEALATYALIEKSFGTSPGLMRAKARMVNPDLPKDSIAAATLYLQQKNLSAAARLLKEMAPAHQQDAVFLALSGDVLYENGNLPAALGYYQRALKITDGMYSVWEKALNIQILLGQFKQMTVMGQEALSRYPNQAILYYYMAFALHRESQNKLALSHIDHAMELDGDNRELQALIFALQAEILIDENKTAEADKAFDKAVALDPNNFLIMNNYAYYLALRGQDLNKAVKLIEIASRALPEDASIADTYALILFKGGRYDLAQTWIEKALQNNEAANNVYLEHYGDILFLRGEPEKALVQWKKAREAGNDSRLLKRKIDEKKYIK